MEDVRAVAENIGRATADDNAVAFFRHLRQNLSHHLNHGVGVEVLPQFVDPSKGHVQLQLAVLGAISLVVGLFSDGAWAIVSGTARIWLARSPRRLEFIGGAGGLVLIGLGVRLAITGRKD